MKIALFAAAALCLAAPAFAEDPTPTPVPNSAANAPVISPDGSLYKAFGGHDGLVRITDDLFVNIAADGRISTFFEAKKIPHIKAMLVEQFCEITGGGCIYSGKDMKSVHSQLGVTEDSFFALVEDLQKAMDKNGVSFADQNKLLGALAPQSRDIVTGPAG